MLSCASLGELGEVGKPTVCASLIIPPNPVVFVCGFIGESGGRSSRAQVKRYMPSMDKSMPPSEYRCTYFDPGKEKKRERREEKKRREEKRKR